MINVTSHDIQLVKQQVQRRYIKIQLLNREFRAINTIIGKAVSGNISIEGESDVRRTASLTLDVIKANAEIYSHLSASYFVRLEMGVEDNKTSEVTWYRQGTFIVANGSFKYSPTTKQLSLSLTDLMIDLNGDRAGTLHAYTSIVKNEQRIDDVIKNVLDLAGFDIYDICSIGVLRETTSFFDEKASDADYLIPYDLEFSAGVTAYDIIEKCVNLYPQYEMGFDVDGIFFVRRKTFEEDNSYVQISAQQLEGLVVEEDTTLDWTSVKNIIEVWGKDGLCYGEAQDDNPDSPFYVPATREMRLVITDSQYGIDTNSIYDRYKDSELAEQLIEQQAEYQATIARLEALETLTIEQQTELAQAKQDLASNKTAIQDNIEISGDDLAAQWAKKLLYEKTRLYDSISLNIIGAPFLNDTDFKISYRSKIDDKVRTYVVKSISHDIQSNTTNLTAIRFYNDQSTAYQSQLQAPEIISYSIDSMTVTINISAVSFAENYSLLIDNKVVANYTSTTLSYTLPNDYEGEHIVSVRANADGFKSNTSENITVTFSAYDVLVTETGDKIVTDSGDKIKLS